MIAKHADTMIPKGFLEGIRKLLVRQLSLAREVEAVEIEQALFGDTSTTFGEWNRVTEENLTEAIHKTGLDIPIMRLRETVELLTQISPDLVQCIACHELAVSNRGGKIRVITMEGANCPFCMEPTLERAQVRHGIISWPTGRIVPVGTQVERLVSPPLPIDESALRAAVGRIDPHFAQIAEQEGVAWGQLLAYAKAIKFPREEPRHLMSYFLPSPGSPPYNLKTEGDLTRFAREALRFVERVEGFRSGRVMGIRVQDRRFQIEGVLGEGSCTRVYQAWRDQVNTGRVIVKLALASADNDLLEREAQIYEAIAKSERPGSGFVRNLTSSLEESAIVVGPDSIHRRALVLRPKPGFGWTLADVMKVYPNGVDAKTGVWMAKRLFDLLSAVHRMGLVHGAIAPEHVLVEPLGHSLALIDWKYATFKSGTRLAAKDVDLERYYPEEVWVGKQSLSPSTDVAMAARTLLDVIDARAELPALRDILRRQAQLDNFVVDEASKVYDRVNDLARTTYGKPKYHPFEFPL